MIDEKERNHDEAYPSMRHLEGKGRDQLGQKEFEPHEKGADITGMTDEDIRKQYKAEALEKWDDDADSDSGLEDWVKAKMREKYAGLIDSVASAGEIKRLPYNYHSIRMRVKDVLESQEKYAEIYPSMIGGKAIDDAFEGLGL